MSSAHLPVSTHRSSANDVSQPTGIPTLTLNDGNVMPMLAYGLGTALYKPDKEEKDQDVLRLVHLAIESGFRHLDSAELYNNESELGEAVKASEIPRNRLFVVTKLCGTEKRNVQFEFNRSLARLGLDYVDLYLVHGPYMANTARELQDVWSEMEAIKMSGKAKSIGVSNFLQEHLEAILETATIRPAINSIEYHPYLQRGALVDFHRQHNIAVSAYSTLTALTQASPGPVDEVYARLARAHGVTPADVALRWCIDQNIAAVTTSRSLERMQGYMRNVMSFKLGQDDIKKLSEAGSKKKYRKFLSDRFAVDDWR